MTAGAISLSFASVSQSSLFNEMSGGLPSPVNLALRRANSRDSVLSSDFAFSPAEQRQTKRNLGQQLIVMHQ
jgi:hypothetical protein